MVTKIAKKKVATIKKASLKAELPVRFKNPSNGGILAPELLTALKDVAAKAKKFKTWPNGGKTFLKALDVYKASLEKDFKEFKRIEGVNLKKTKV